MELFILLAFSLYACWLLGKIVVKGSDLVKLVALPALLFCVLMTWLWGTLIIDSDALGLRPSYEEQQAAEERVYDEILVKLIDENRPIPGHHQAWVVRDPRDLESIVEVDSVEFEKRLAAYPK